MRSDINLYIVSGTLDAEPKVSYTKNDNKIVSINLAVASVINSDEGQKTITSWRKVVCFNSNVSVIAEKLQKGDQVLVQGPISVRTWVDNASGQKRSSYEVVASSITPLGAQATKNSDQLDNRYPADDKSDKSERSAVDLDDEIFG